MMKFRLHSFHYRVILIIVGTALYFMANVQRTAIPGPIFNVLQQDLQVSAPYITSLGAAFMYVYAINQLFSGILIEKYGGARVIAAGSLLFCLGSLMFPLSGSLFWLYFSRALTGLGASAIYLSLVKEIKRASSDKNFSIALSVMIFAGYTGGIMANAPFVAGVSVIGWRPMMLLIALASIAFFVLFLLSGYMTKLPKIHREKRISFRPFGELLRIRHNLYILGFSGLNFGMFYVIQTMIGKKFLEDFCLMSSSGAA
jgi:MFS family permease